MPLRPCVACVEASALVQMVGHPCLADEAVLSLVVVRPLRRSHRRSGATTPGASQLLRPVLQTSPVQVLTCHLLVQTKLSTGPNSLGPVPRAPSPRPPLGHRSPLPLASAPPLHAALRLCHLPRPPAPVMTGPSRCPICQHPLLSPDRAHHRSLITSRSASSRVTSTWIETAFTYSRSGRRFGHVFLFCPFRVSGQASLIDAHLPLAQHLGFCGVLGLWEGCTTVVTYFLGSSKRVFHQETGGKQIMEFSYQLGAKLMAPEESISKRASG